MKDTTNIVTADARTFPLIESSSNSEPTVDYRDSQQEIDSRKVDEPFNDPTSQREIDSLVPYVDLARMSRERYERIPSIQTGERMAKDRSTLVNRVKRTMDSLRRRYPDATQEEVKMALLQRFPSLKMQMNPHGTTGDAIND